MPPDKTVGRTWADVAATFPLWLLGTAASGFVLLLLYSVALASHPFQLGFLGTFGPNDVLSDTIPQGGVLAFDRSDLDEDHCPPGWSPFLRARARTLVGAGDPSKAPDKLALDGEKRQLVGYAFREAGGEQIHKLKLDELPLYSPVVIKEGGAQFSLKESSAVPCLDNGCNNLGVISEGRRGQASIMLSISGFGKEDNHNNVTSPFIAVYYCKKD